MIYTVTINTLVANTIDNAVNTTLRVTKGFVYRLELDIHQGAAGLLHVQIFDGSFQLYPSSPKETFYGDGLQLRFDESYLKLVEPFEFTIKTWNVDATYDHKCQVRIGMVSKEIFMARFLPSVSYKYYKQMIEEIQAEQEAQRQAILDRPFDWMPVPETIKD